MAAVEPWSLGWIPGAAGAAEEQAVPAGRGRDGGA